MRLKLLSISIALLLITTLSAPLSVFAAESGAPSDAGLSLEVSPSPIVLTIKPGEKKSVEVKIYNAGTAVEQLKLSLQSFKVDPKNSRVTLLDSAPAEVNGWVVFSQPRFSVKPGERFTQRVTIEAPASAGFSYNFAIIINRQTAPRISQGRNAVVGSVAIFTLLNIDRPGAVRKLSFESVTTDRKFYEYLPATIKLRIKNDGNSLVLPAGNVYVQRTADSNEPISVLSVNPGSLYLLPGVTRDYDVAWSDGLPAYVTRADAANAPPSKHLEWNWRNSQIRIGKYVARTVVTYSDGVRDVPLQAEVSFWVIPWKILLGLLVAIIVLGFGLYAIARFTILGVKRNRFKYRA